MVLPTFTTWCERFGTCTSDKKKKDHHPVLRSLHCGTWVSHGMGLCRIFVLPLIIVFINVSEMQCVVKKPTSTMSGFSCRISLRVHSLLTRIRWQFCAKYAKIVWRTGSMTIFIDEKCVHQHCAVETTSPTAAVCVCVFNCLVPFATIFFPTWPHFLVWLAKINDVTDNYSCTMLSSTSLLRCCVPEAHTDLQCNYKPKSQQLWNLGGCCV